MMHLDTGYDLWVRNVDKSLMSDKLDNFLTVADEAKKDLLLIQKYFLFSLDPVTLTYFALNNGPCRTITTIESDDYPQAVHNIKKFFLSNLPISGFPQAMASTGTFTFQLQRELEMETEAKKGITKLMFIHNCTNVDYKGLSVSNNLFATP